jgi:crotonobetaine/carnitine-CoA ligase
MGGLTMLLGTLMAGGRVAVYRRFSVSNFWPEIQRTGATVAFLISVMITLVAEGPDTPISEACHGQLRMISGAPLGADMQRVFRSRFGVPISGPAGYGLSEATPIVRAIIGEEGVPADSSGRETPDFEMRIVDDAGADCPPGAPGVVMVRPRRPQVMMEGYWGDAEATEQVMADGWFSTGDIGKLDTHGYFYFVDRAKDYLRRGGENISSFEMETAFRSHPAIADAVVHAVRSDMSEDEVKVTAVLRPGAALTEEELCRWSLNQVPHFAVPRYIEFRDELPRNQVGRVLKYTLRDEGVTATTWDRAGSSVVVRRP